MATYAGVAGGSMFGFFQWPFTTTVPIENISGTATSATVENTSKTTLTVTLAVTYTGSGLSWSGTTPDDGTYTSMQFALDGVTIGTLSGFSAAAFDQITTIAALDVLDGNDTLNGTGGQDVLWGGQDGTDTFNGNGGNDTFSINAPDSVARSHVFTGADGSFDTVAVGGADVVGRNVIDLRSASFISIEAMTLAAQDPDGLAAIINASQLGAGLLSSTTAFTGFGSGATVEIHLTAGGSFDLSTMTFANITPAVVGSGSADTLFGSPGGDVLDGKGGNDVLDGKLGNDEIGGGKGRDTLTGGKDADDFNFAALNEMGKTAAKRDVILDFKAESDDIDLSVIDANGAASGDKFKFLATEGAAFTGKAGQLHWFQENNPGKANDRTIVEGDVDGNGKADFQIELSGLIDLHKGDFVL